MLLNINDLNVSLGGLHILHDVNLTVEEKEIVVVIGANGAGKSTLMRTIAGLSHPTSGSINFRGTQLEKMPPNLVAGHGISMVPEGRMLFYDMTVLENLEMGATVYHKDKARIKKNLDYVFSLFPVLYDHQDRKASTFSGGEQQMISIGRGLMSEPKLLMIDELSLGLAQKVIDMLLKIVKQLNDSGISILMVEQNVKQALKIADRAYVIDNGSITMSGTGEELINNDYVRKAYMGL